ncbi:MAG: hypothetical protein V1895_00855 [Parcubacteria group bacterium]
MASPQATPSPRENSKRFMIAFLISLSAMVAAAIVYVVVGERFAFDFKTQALIATLVLIGAIVGLWLLQRGEKHTGYGVLFGSFYGILLGGIAVVLIALLLLGFPASGL